MQVFSATIPLDLAVQLINVRGNYGQDALCPYVLVTPAKKTPEIHVRLYLSERTLRLYASVHLQQDSFGAGYLGQSFRTFLLKVF